MSTTFYGTLDNPIPGMSIQPGQAFPTDRQGTLVEIDALPSGATVDNIFYFNSPTAGKFLRRVIDGAIRAAQCGVYPGSDQTAKLQTAFNNAGIKLIVLDYPEGSAITINGTLTIPSGKVLAFKNGNKLTGTGTIKGKITADECSHILDPSLNLNEVESELGYLPAAWFGVVGDGVTENTAAFNKIKANVKHSLVQFSFPRGSDILFNGSIDFLYAKTFKIMPGVRFTGDGNLVQVIFDAGYTQEIFGPLMDVQFPRSVTGMMSVKWYGCKGDGVTNDNSAMMRAIGVPNSRFTDLFVPAGTYLLTGTDINISGAYSKKFIFETGAKFTGTVLIRQVIIQADYNAHIADTTVLFSDPKPYAGLFSVKWYGALGNDTANDTEAVNKANTALIERGKLYFPRGIYRLDGALITNEVVGDGRTTTLKAWDTNTQVVFKVGRHIVSTDTGLRTIENFVVDGSNVAYGLQFNNGGTDDMYSGRWRFRDIVFAQCVRSIDKPNGNFGNVFDGCSFTGSAATDFHYYAQDVIGMHAGLDKFFNCRFFGSRKAAVYISDAEGGGTRFQDCVFEYNYGFSIFIKKGGVKHHVLPVVIDNCWMEGNASGSINSFTAGVNINGEIFTTPFDFHFEQCNAVKLQNTAMCRIKLIKSAVFADTVSYAYQPGRVVEKDADSLFVEKTKFGWNMTDSGAYLADKIAYASETGGARFRSIFPAGFTGKNIPGLLFANKLDTLNGFTHGGSFNMSLQQDGELTYNCIEISNVTASGYINPTTYTPTVGKYIVAGIGMKLISGPQAFMMDNNSNILLAQTSTIGQWEYFYTILKLQGAGSRTLYVDAGRNAGSTFRISCLMYVEFDTHQEAVEFVRKNVFPGPPTFQNSIKTVSANYSTIPDDETILVNTNSGNVTITYNSTMDTKIRSIVNIGTAGNQVTILPSVGTIDGNPSAIVADGATKRLQSNLTNVYSV
jgi:hypothetical protein